MRPLSSGGAGANSLPWGGPGWVFYAFLPFFFLLVHGECLPLQPTLRKLELNISNQLPWIQKVSTPGLNGWEGVCTFTFNQKKLKTFEELGVSEAIRRAIEELGFEHPMPVQEEVIPYLLGNKNDVIALAQTGTGKTAAFGLPLLQKVDAQNRATQAIVLSPTRELCVQIADDLKDFSKYIDGLHVVPVYGGADIRPQIRTIKHGVQIVVATPGRLVDLINRGVMELSQVNNVVLDEADEMLNMGFSDSINAIFEHASFLGNHEP